jgi:plasmid stability protein
MAPAIQIRNVPDALHRDLKARAAEAGMSLSAYLLAELRDLAVRPSMREWLEQAESWETVDITESPSEALVAERRR